MKKALVACFLLALLPLTTYAATVEELRAQIEELLRRVNSLQSTVTPGATSAAGGQCPLISRTLKVGSTGDDVSRLQAFLARDAAVYPEGTVSGYYGALTEAAVKRFQCNNKIVCDGSAASTGYGVTGPRTAALMALQCPGGTGAPVGSTSSNVGGFIRVNPTQGTAPLTVTIEATVNTTRSCTGATYEIHYGDGTVPASVIVPNGRCTEMLQSLSHRYNSAGTYTLSLRAGGHQSYATVVVTGGTSGTGSESDTISGSPTSGTAPLNVSFTGKANASGSCSPKAYTLSFGDGSTTNIPVSDCSISTYAVTHGYSSGGNYTAKLIRAGDQIGSVSISVTGGNPTGSTQGGGSFTAELGYGGDVFTVLARFALTSSCTAYDIDWGDASAHATQSTGSCASGQVTKEVSHTYSGNGNYTITLKRGSGSGQTTDTVAVAVVY